MTESSLKIGKEKIFITGYPRNDSFFNKSKSDKKYFYQYIQKDTKKVILYAPSWRNSRKPTKFFPFNDFEQLKEQIEHDIKNKSTGLELMRNNDNFAEMVPQYESQIRILTNKANSFESAEMMLPHMVRFTIDKLRSIKLK